MNPIHTRFSPLQRALHWVMAICILAMLFIGVGMVSTVKPDYLTLVSIHKPLGVVILVLALIRLVVPIPEANMEGLADTTGREFMQALFPLLGRYLPT